VSYIKLLLSFFLFFNPIQSRAKDIITCLVQNIKNIDNESLNEIKSIQQELAYLEKINDDPKQIRDFLKDYEFDGHNELNIKWPKTITKRENLGRNNAGIFDLSIKDRPFLAKDITQQTELLQLAEVQNAKILECRRF